MHASIYLEPSAYKEKREGLNHNPGVSSYTLIGSNMTDLISDWVLSGDSVTATSDGEDVI